VSRWRVVSVTGTTRVCGFRLHPHDGYRWHPNIDRATMFRTDTAARAAATGCALSPHEYRVERVIIVGAPK